MPAGFETQYGHEPEPPSPALDATLSAWAGAGGDGCIVAPRPGEAVGPGARAVALG